MVNFYNYVLQELNQNEQGVRFEGNIFFYFHPHNNDFVLYNVNEEELRIEKLEYVPFVENTSDEITYVDANQRSDFHKMYIVPIKIENNVEFDLQSKPYNALLDFAKAKNGKTFTHEGFKYTLKVTEPRPEGVPILKRGAGWYRLFSVSIAMTRLVDGTFGNELTLELTTDIDGTMTTDDIDFLSFTPSAATDVQVERDLTTFGNNFNLPIARQNEFEVTLNYRDTAIDRKLLDFAFASDDTDIDNTFVMTMTLPHKTYTKNVILTQAAASFEKGIVVSVTARFSEREG